MNRLTKMLKSFARGMAELSPSCREATRLQSEAMDRPLSLRKRIGLRIHLMLCRWCHRYGRQIGFLRSVTHEHEKHDQMLPPQTLRPEAKERMKERLKSEK
ncbi:MAG: zf-HC2 domain-containing protein [Verrucomicrobiota bacterium]